MKPAYVESETSQMTYFGESGESNSTPSRVRQLSRQKRLEGREDRRSG